MLFQGGIAMKLPFRKCRSILSVALSVALLFGMSLGFVYVSGQIPSTPPALDKADLLAQASRASTLEGTFYAADGVTPLTAATTPGQGGKILYPSLDRLIGYNSYGTSGLRHRWDQALFDDPGGDGQGASIHTTLDPYLSELLYQMTEGLEDAAAIVLNADTGAVLGCVSIQQGVPFDADQIDSLYETYSTMPGFLIDNSIAASQPGGSILKLITAAAVLDSATDQTYMDTGLQPTPGGTVQNFGAAALGPLDLKTALVKSSNCYFASKAMSLGAKPILDAFHAFGFEQDIRLEDMDLTISQSLDPSAGSSIDTLARIAFGYCNTTSPLMAAAMYGSVLKGEMYLPYFVQQGDQDNGPLYTAQPQLLGQPLSSEALPVLQDALSTAATSYGLQADGLAIYAKTGTSEHSDGVSNNLWMAAAIQGKTSSWAVCLMRKAPQGISSHDMACPMQLILNYLAALDAQ